MGYLRRKPSSNSLRERLSFNHIAVYYSVFRCYDHKLLFSAGMNPEKTSTRFRIGKPRTTRSSSLCKFSSIICFRCSRLRLQAFLKKKESETGYLSIGYLAFFAQICINGIVAGTWSFSLGGRGYSVYLQNYPNFQFYT